MALSSADTQGMKNVFVYLKSVWFYGIRLNVQGWKITARHNRKEEYVNDKLNQQRGRVGNSDYCDIALQF